MVQREHWDPALGRLVRGAWVGRGHSLRVYLVEGSVHAHRGPEPRQLLVLPQACEDSRQGRGAEVGRAEGDDSAGVMAKRLAIIKGRLGHGDRLGMAVDRVLEACPARAQPLFAGWWRAGQIGGANRAGQWKGTWEAQGSA